MTEKPPKWPFPDSLAADYFLQAFSLEHKYEAELLRDRLGAGQFYSIAPANAETERLRKLDEGGLFPQREKVRHGDYLVQPVNNCNPGWRTQSRRRSATRRIPGFGYMNPF